MNANSKSSKSSNSIQETIPQVQKPSPTPEESSESKSTNDELHEKFAALKSKMSKLRSSNIKEMVAEEQDLNPSKAHNLKKRKKSKKRKRKFDEFSITAEESEYHKKKKRKIDKHASFTGWEVYSDAQKYRVYSKSCKELPIPLAAINGKEEVLENQPEEERKNEEEEEDDTREVFISDVKEEGKNRLVEHLQKANQKRKKFNRRRVFLENQKINYINERNRKYNKKIEKAYGSFTKELRNAIDEAPRF